MGLSVADIGLMHGALKTGVSRVFCGMVSGLGMKLFGSLVNIGTVALHKTGFAPV